MRCTAASTFGKGEHHAVGLTAAGKKIYDKAPPNDEAKLRAVFDRLPPRDRCWWSSTNRTPSAPCRSPWPTYAATTSATCPDRRCAASPACTPDKQKTDARDAFIVADTARTMAHTCARSSAVDEALANPVVLVGFDDDLAGEATRVSNRIRGLLTSVRPLRPSTPPSSGSSTPG